LIGITISRYDVVQGSMWWFAVTVTWFKIDWVI
jgi:hypothetical protein